MLWHWLHVALWDPPPAELRPIEVLQHAGVRIYAEGWGRSTDVGVVAVVAGQDAGACWMRLLPEGIGLASIDATTPQLGIALDAAYRGKGYGKSLLRAALQAAWAYGYRRVSLTVHPQNPAVGLYEACGFSRRGLRGADYLMIAEHAPEQT
jgi:GNAT superfamily N-acetyltransferase